MKIYFKSFLCKKILPEKSVRVNASVQKSPTQFIIRETEQYKTNRSYVIIKSAGLFSQVIEDSASAVTTF